MLIRAKLVAPIFIISSLSQSAQRKIMSPNGRNNQSSLYRCKVCTPEKNSSRRGRNFLSAGLRAAILVWTVFWFSNCHNLICALRMQPCPQLLWKSRFKDRICGDYICQFSEIEFVFEYLTLLNGSIYGLRSYFRGLDFVQMGGGWEEKWRKKSHMSNGYVS